MKRRAVRSAMPNSASIQGREHTVGKALLLALERQAGCYDALRSGRHARFDQRGIFAGCGLILAAESCIGEQARSFTNVVQKSEGARPMAGWAPVVLALAIGLGTFLGTSCGAGKKM